MNPTLMWAAFRRTHWIRLALLTIIFIAGYFTIAAEKTVLAGEGAWFVWVLGAGIIGKDVSEGVLNLLFSRPIKRAEYVFSKWMAVGLMASAMTWLYLAVGWSILWHLNEPPAWTQMGTSLVLALLICFGASAALVFLSTLVPGIGDLALMFLILLAGQLLEWWVAGQPWPLVKWFLHNIIVFLFPGMGWQNMGLGDISLFDWIGYFSIVTIWLTLAVGMMNRKEITYANS
jgi:ABC-type transport system involved in multi-copper enzyme maturation permease subunit